jgi:hypothetical protein
MSQLTVSDLARQADVSPHTVHYYDRRLAPHAAPISERTAGVWLLCS